MLKLGGGNEEYRKLGILAFTLIKKSTLSLTGTSTLSRGLTWTLSLRLLWLSQSTQNKRKPGNQAGGEIFHCEVCEDLSLHMEILYASAESHTKV